MTMIDVKINGICIEFAFEIIWAAQLYHACVLNMYLHSIGVQICKRMHGDIVGSIEISFHMAKQYWLKSLQEKLNKCIFPSHLIWVAVNQKYVQFILYWNIDVSIHWLLNNCCASCTIILKVTSLASALNVLAVLWSAGYRYMWWGL